MEGSGHYGHSEVVQVQDLSPFLVHNHVQVGELIAVDRNAEQRNAKVLSLHDGIVSTVRDEQLRVVVRQNIRLWPPEGCVRINYIPI